MHKLTNDRMRWGLYEFLAGVLVGIILLFCPGLAGAVEAILNPGTMIPLGSLCQVVSRVTALALLQDIQAQPGRKAATYLSAGIAWLPLLGPFLAMAVLWILLPLWPLVPLLPVFLALWLLRTLARMRQWKALRVGLIALTVALMVSCGWLWLLRSILSESYPI